MASEPSGAIINFPTGTDIYVSKTDFGVIVSGESHTIPFAAPYVVSLTHVPQLGNPSLVFVPGFTEVTGTPGVNQFQINYSGTGAGNGLFSAFNAGNPITVTYTTAGDVTQAEWFNSLQTSVVNIENFIGSGLGIAGNYVPITGATVNGTITLNGGSLVTSSSGSNQIGVGGTPFAVVYANNIVANTLTSPNGLNSVSFGGSVTVSGDGSASLVSNNAVYVSGNNTVTITANNSGVTVLSEVGGVAIAGHTVPTASSTFDLGSTTNRWRKVYADEVTITSGPFVRTTGDTMTGALVMSTGASLNSDTINNATSSLSINSSADIEITSAGNIIIESNTTSLNGVLTTIDTFGTTVSAPIVPDTPSAIDIGSTTSPFRTIYADNIVGGANSGNFVKITGDTMSGDLTMGFGTAINVDNINPGSPSGLITMSVGELAITAFSNIHFDTGPTGTQKLEIGLTEISLSTDIIPTISGLYDIGAASLPLRAIYADNLHINAIASGSVINGATFGNPTVTGTLTLGTGASIASQGSGTVTIGSPSNPIGTIYASSIVTAGSTGNFISKFGDTMIGNLALGTGSNITAVGSGVNNIGSASNPLGTIYANNIVSSGANGLYVLKTGDTMSGPLVLNKIYSTGTLVISGNQISETAEQINVKSTNGPIIVDANTEMQLLVNTTATLTLNVSGTESFRNIFPDTSGTHSLGTPQKPWDSIYAVNIIPVGVNTSGNFVLKIGDTMSGDLDFTSGVGIKLLQSGTSDIGTASSPLRAVYADNLIIGSPSGAFVHITGDVMTGNLTLFGGAKLVGDNSVFEITTASAGQSLLLNPVSGVQINGVAGNILLNAIGTHSITAQATTGPINLNNGSGKININSAAGVVGISGNGVLITSNGSEDIAISGNGGGSGDVVIKSSAAGNIIISGSSVAGNKKVEIFAGAGANNFIQTQGNIVPLKSGSDTLGSQSIPFTGAYFQNINGFAATRQVYNEIPTGSVNGINPTFTTALTPASGTQRLYAGGLRQTPGASFDYQISGNMFTFTNIPPSGTNLLIDYEVLAF